MEGRGGKQKLKFEDGLSEAKFRVLVKCGRQAARLCVVRAAIETRK